jgi:hypothetical protein
MPKKSHYRKVKRGGGAYSSASSYGTYVNGTGPSQYDRVFSQNSPDASNPSNNIWGAQGQNLGLPPNTPNQQQLSLIQSAGRRRTRSRMMSRNRMMSRTRSRRGGYFGEVISQAVVPFSLLGLQQTFRRKGKKSQRKQSKRRGRK